MHRELFLLIAIWALAGVVDAHTKDVELYLVGPGKQVQIRFGGADTTTYYAVTAYVEVVDGRTIKKKEILRKEGIARRGETSTFEISYAELASIPHVVKARDVLVEDYSVPDDHVPVIFDFWVDLSDKFPDGNAFPDVTTIETEDCWHTIDYGTICIGPHTVLVFSPSLGVPEFP